MNTPTDPTAGEGLSEAEKTHGRMDPGLQWRGRWYSEASVERIVAARESATATRARAEEREAWSSWLDGWLGAVGPKLPTVEDVARALRSGPRPFGCADALATDAAGESA